MQQQMLAQHQQSQPQASPEYLTSSRSTLPALVSYSLPTSSPGVGPMMDSSYSANSKYFSTEHKGKSLGGRGVTMELESFHQFKWLLNLEPIFYSPLTGSLTSPLLWSLCISVLPSIFTVSPANCSLQIRLSNIQQHLRLRKEKGKKLLSKAVIVVSQHNQGIKNHFIQ